ncbi:MAG: peptidylprolyl isomerase [Phycisphaerae bacterium]|nr:peptidylprolyl isomerase [Phycisphaerae bacterium]
MRKMSPVVALSFVVLLCLSGPFLTPRSLGASASEPSQAPGQAKDPNRSSAAPDVSVVARIGGDTILQKDLEERLLREIRPHEEEYAPQSTPVTAEAVLRIMLGEKAMSLEGRSLGYLKDEAIRPGIEQFEQQQLARMLLDRELRDRVTAEPADVNQAMKANPKWTREQATAMVQQAVANRLFESFHQGLVEKFHLKKEVGNFAQAAEIHQRLLQRPVEKRGPGEFWIKNSQVKNELTEQEKHLVLAGYEGGTFTLEDWFLTVCNIAPPRRPQDLSTSAGVEKLLDRALRLPILVAEAKARGYDKDEKLRSEIRQLEDQNLLYKVQEEKTKGMGEPTAEQIKAYFEKNKDRFAQAAILKINQIWCENLEAAKKVKAVLEGGADFETAKKVHSLQREEAPHVVTAVGEGLFWAELWKADPNQTVGPIRGFYGSGVKWRMVKILEKTPAKAQPYSEQLANSIKWTLIDEQRQHVLEEYRMELLKKYPCEIFGDRIKGLDPLEIAAKQGDR